MVLLGVNMAIRWKHWCPHGCGKTVIYNLPNRRIKARNSYICTKCGKKIKKSNLL